MGNSRMPCHLAVNHCIHPWWCTLRGLRMRTHNILFPDGWGTYQKNDFSECGLLHLPIYRKALNSLAWDIWFSLISSNILMFWLLGPCCKTSYILAPPLPLWSSLSELSEMLCPGLKSQFCLPNKTQFSTFRLCFFVLFCFFFFSWHYAY